MNSIMWEIIFVFSAWWLGTYILKRKKILPWHGLDFYGPFPILRSSSVNSIIERLAIHGNVWKVFAWLGIIFTVILSIIYTSAILYSDYILLFLPKTPGPVISLRDALLIPGINRHIPLLWGWIGLIVAVVAHEIGHAVVALTQGVKIKSMGILLPLGAFTDIDEAELAAQSRIKRTRILSAGVFANLLVAVISLALFFGPVLGSIVPSNETMAIGNIVPGGEADILGLSPGMIITHVNDTPVSGEEMLDLKKMNSPIAIRVLDRGINRTFHLNKSDGILIVGLLPDYPAQIAGLRVGMRIQEVDDMPISKLSDFMNYMKNTSSGQSIMTRVLINGSFAQFNITLSQPPHDIQRGWLGVKVSDDPFGVMFIRYQPQTLLDMLKSLSHEPKGILKIPLLPFLEVIGLPAFGGFTGNLPDLYRPIGWAEPFGAGIFQIANILFWVGWVNLQLALFNSLPINYMDGGYIFKDWINAILDRVTDTGKAERTAKLLSWGMTILLILSMLSVLIIPYVL